MYAFDAAFVKLYIVRPDISNLLMGRIWPTDPMFDTSGIKKQRYLWPRVLSTFKLRDVNKHEGDTLPLSATVILDVNLIMPDGSSGRAVLMTRLNPIC